MAIDYRIPGSGGGQRINPVESFRSGLQARGDVYQNQNLRESLIARQFANARDPIVAQQNDEMYAQNLALKSAQEQQALNAVKLDNQKADRDLYDASLQKVGSILYGVTSDKEIPLAIQHLKSLRESGVIHPTVYDNFEGMVAQTPLTVEGAKYLGTTALGLKDQIDRENKMRDDAYTAQKDANQLAFDRGKWQDEFKIKKGNLAVSQGQLNETIRNNKDRNAIDRSKLDAIPAQKFKSLPPALKEDISFNETQKGLIDEAMALVNANPNAVGLPYKNSLYKWQQNYQGNDDEIRTRTLIGQLSSLTIKNISGAAVSANEEARLKQWIPKVDDPPNVIKNKLVNFKKELDAMNRQRLKAYPSELGYEKIPGWEDIYNDSNNSKNANDPLGLGF